MKSKLLLGLIIFVALAVVHCNKSDSAGNPVSGESASGFQNQSKTSTVILKIVDVSTRASLSDAEIELIAGTKTKSNANGEVKIDTVPGGNYFVHVSKSGYEPITDTLAVKIQGELSPIALTTSRILELHKIGVKVNGRILIKTDRIKSTTLAASDVAVELRLIGNFQNPIRTVKTNKNGVFTFDSLPEFAEYLIRIPEFSMEGKKFNLNNLYANQSFSVGDDFTFPISILSPIDAGNFVVLSSLTTTLNPGKPLTIQFSNKVDTSSLQAGSITLSNSNFALAAEFSWSDDLTTLNIMPYHSDWLAGARYLVALNGLYDAQGQPLKNNPNQNLFTLSASLATPEPGSIKVSGLHVRASVYNPINHRNVDSNVVDYNTSSYQLIWNHITGITSYELYSRDGADSVWRFENNMVTDTQVSVFSSIHLNKPFYRQHMVLPHSDKLNTNFNGADSITIKDGVKPTFGSSSTIAPLNSFYNALNNLSGTTKKIVSYQVLIASGNNGNYPEPLDTTKVPDVTVLERSLTQNNLGDATYVAKSLGFKWTSPTAGILDLEVEAGKNGSYDSLIIDFSKITDLAGNAFDANFSTPVLKAWLY